MNALSSLFVQALQLRRKASLATLGHVSMEGTTMQVAVSKHKAMSHGRMSEEEARAEGSGFP